MANTTNFNWETPDDTDLVKDGAAAIRTLGSSIDTSFVDLKGGTTGQVLAKASNTDLDFNWIAVDPLTILDAKGDLISATAADTPARLAVGSNGQVLTADSTASTGLKWASVTQAVVAVKAAFKSDTFSMSSSTFSDVTGLSITYTPTSASNKILLIATISATGQNGTSGFNFRFLRGATAIGVGDASGALTQATISSQAQDDNNPAAVAMSYLDSPATTSSTTWKVQMRMAAGTGYVNRSTSDTLARNSSNLLLLEVAP
jgi:hypothetical protein